MSLFFSSRRRHTRFDCDWSSDVCSSDLGLRGAGAAVDVVHFMPRPRGGDWPWTVEAQAGGRYLACPVEDDPAHALNRAWSALSGDGAREDVTHVVAFGGSRPLVAGPGYA